ncbi:MAG TPA: DUF2157 domain-containing protein [Verrucomicrobiae bacterium]|nr:DUF2157 domain-containing protein [Verrucomicrobiae bacterium]
MKTEDIEKIHAAGLITGEQRDRIITHFGLKDEGNKFLMIISFVGAVLIAAGITLLISAHWDAIPRGVKIAAGLVLMLGAHGGGWWLREVQGVYRKTGEALQLAGSLLFLANIALVGQIYHLASRTPDAFLLWLIGIAALPWLLRSKAQLVLMLVAFCTWFGCEINERDSLIYFGSESQVLIYSLLGLIFIGAGYWLRRTTFAEFASTLEKTGALGALLFAYPLTWAGFMDWGHENAEVRPQLLLGLGGGAVLLVALGVRQLAALDSQWRRTWGATLAGAAVLLCGAFFTPQERGYHWVAHLDGVNTVAVIALFVFCLLQIQVGLQQRSRFMVNLGVVFIGLDIISAYFGLLGTMALTGAMFVLTGVFLIVFGVFLERKRRTLMRQIKTNPVMEAA